MNTCETCKWWKPPLNEGSGTCVLISDTPEDSPAFDDDSEYTDDAWVSGNCRGAPDHFLYTEPTFGCTLHEPKEEQN